jgi:hypothetical protein
MSNQSRFVVEQLKPRTMDGSPSGLGTYELSRESINSEVITGRDRLGRPVIETRPLHYHREFGTADGCRNFVPLRTGAIYSTQPDAVAYEYETIYDLLMAGWIPIEACPFTDAYKSITKTPCLVANPDKIADCGGKPDGCEHLIALLAERREVVRAENEAAEQRLRAMSPKQAAALAQSMSEAMSIISAASREPDNEDPTCRPSRPARKG